MDTKTDTVGWLQLAGKRARHPDTIAVAVVAIGIIAAMQIASYFAPDYVMPSPTKVVVALGYLLVNENHHMIVTLLRLLLAVTVSLVIGTMIGVIMGTSKRLYPYLNALVIADTGVPALSWMLLAVFWFRNPEARIFFILTIVLLPFYALNINDGIQALSKDNMEMLDSFRPTRWQTLKYLIIPHIVPYIILTTKSVIGYAIRLAIFAELIATAVGIGARMSIAQSTMKMAEVLGWTFFLVILNLVVQALVVAVEKRMLRWRPEVSMR